MAQEPKGESESGLWIRPRQNIKGPDGERAMEDRHGHIPSHSRLLELADIALGTKKSILKKGKKQSPAHETTKKKEPYST